MAIIDLDINNNKPETAEEKTNRLLEIERRKKMSDLEKVDEININKFDEKYVALQLLKHITRQLCIMNIHLAKIKDNS